MMDKAHILLKGFSLPPPFSPPLPSLPGTPWYPPPLTSWAPHIFYTIPTAHPTSWTLRSFSSCCTSRNSHGQVGPSRGCSERK